jgi:putative cell wall-binding protein
VIPAGRLSRASIRTRARVGAVVAALVVPTLIVATSANASNDVPEPSQWPASAAVAPELESWSNAIRYAGPNREQTSLALALGLRGQGDYPFDTPDPSSGGAATLGAANDWWGVGTCPRSIIIVAGDTPADSLAASALSDPTDQSAEPFLRRSAAADPLFDPVGGFARVDTQTAPIIVTRSARQGATALGAPARLAAQDLRSGGCNLARQAIIVGGPAAVPTGVDNELVALGYDEVFRVAGSDRYATAASIAGALGTGTFKPPGTPCTDLAVNDGDARMGFYGNASIELRDSATTCRVLGRSVVLAEGLTGADALAAGWWTSFWQVPVLLHDGSATLPAATAQALITLGVDNIIVLGGTSRIPDSVLADAENLSGGVATRISGADRYETSVEMARRLGGWWPTGRADEYAGSLICVAASSGNGATGRGWPDALGAGPWCGAANGAAAGTEAPVRALAPLTGEAPISTAALPAGSNHDAVPVLLVPAGATALPASVQQLLTGSFEPTDSFCSSVQAAAGCTVPGFVVAVGGESVLTSALIAQTAQLVAGNTPSSGSSAPPALDRAFFTSLNLAPVYASTPSSDHVCVGRDDYIESRWLAVLGASTSARVFASTDAMLTGRYGADADGVTRSPGVGAPICTSFNLGSRTELRARGVGIAGRVGPETMFAPSATTRVQMTAPIADVGPDSATGVESSDDTSNAGSTVQTYVTNVPGTNVVSKGIAAAITSGAVTVTISRGTDLPSSTGVDRFSATASLNTPNGTITATATGEALFVGGTWQLRGRTTMTGGSWNVTGGLGGFTADIVTGDPDTMSDDTISWRLDALAD